MIIDSIKNASTYYGIDVNMKKAFEFALTLTDKEVGKYQCEELEEGILFAMVQEGSTNPAADGKLENHQDYLDIQIMLDGSEEVGYEDVDGLAESIPYDKTKDIAFFDATEKLQMITISKNMFYIVYPQDGHMPCRHSENERKYRKIVVKLKIK